MYICIYIYASPCMVPMTLWKKSVCCTIIYVRMFIKKIPQIILNCK